MTSTPRLAIFFMKHTSSDFSYEKVCFLRFKSMKLEKSVDVLWFQPKLVVSYIGKLNTRWKRGPSRKDLPCSDGGYAMCGLGLSSGGELFLISLDVTRSLDQADMHS